MSSTTWSLLRPSSFLSPPSLLSRVETTQHRSICFSLKVPCGLERPIWGSFVCHRNCPVSCQTSGAARPSGPGPTGTLLFTPLDCGCEDCQEPGQVVAQGVSSTKEMKVSQGYRCFGSLKFGTSALAVRVVLFSMRLTSRPTSSAFQGQHSVFAEPRRESPVSKESRLVSSLTLAWPQNGS